MDLSFILLTWNSEKYLERCLVRLEQAMAKTALSYEVLILDNGSRDITPVILERLAGKRPGVIVPYLEPTNTGTTRPRNLLFENAKGRLLCVMDSDVELAEGVMTPLVKFIEEDKRLGIVVPLIRYPSGAWQKSFDRFPTLFSKINRLFRLRSIEESEGARFSEGLRPFFVDYAISAFWLMRRELLDVVGTLDERIFYSPEDADFCLRVWKCGYRILYVPDVSVVHHTQEISRGVKMNLAKFSHIKGLFYYFLKHRYLLRPPRYPGLQASELHWPEAV